MIMGYFVEDGRLRGAAAPLEAAEHIVWFDVLNPMPHDKVAIEKVIGVTMPTREKMEEIEESSRLYVENGAIYMTITLPARVDRKIPEMAPVTFILAGQRLVTVHDHEPRAFQTFPQHAEKAPSAASMANSVLIALVEAIIERLADILEKIEPRHRGAVARRPERRRGWQGQRLSHRPRRKSAARASCCPKCWTA